jgi:hypothetical protein
LQLHRTGVAPACLPVLVATHSLWALALCTPCYLAALYSGAHFTGFQPSCYMGRQAAWALHRLLQRSQSPAWEPPSQVNMLFDRLGDTFLHPLTLTDMLHEFLHLLLSASPVLPYQPAANKHDPFLPDVHLQPCQGSLLPACLPMNVPCDIALCLPPAFILPSLDNLSER